MLTEYQAEILWHHLNTDTPFRDAGSPLYLHTIHALTLCGAVTDTDGRVEVTENGRARLEGSIREALVVDYRVADEALYEA